MSAHPGLPSSAHQRLGWRARIGVITPAVGMAVTADFHRIAPEGVAMVLAAVPRPLVAETEAELIRVSEGVLSAARRLLVPRASVALWNTSSDFMTGVGSDLALIERIRETTGLRATTTSTAMVEAFRALGLRSVALATPYSQVITERQRDFVEAHGVRVPRLRGMGLLDVSDLLDTPPAAIADLVREADSPEAEAIFVSNTGWSALEAVEGLEAELGKPILTANQVSLWAAFRLAGIPDRVEGFGRLLREA